MQPKCLRLHISIDSDIFTTNTNFALNIFFPVLFAIIWPEVHSFFSRGFIEYRLADFVTFELGL